MGTDSEVFALNECYLNVLRIFWLLLYRCFRGPGNDAVERNDSCCQANHRAPHTEENALYESERHRWQQEHGGLPLAIEPLALTKEMPEHALRAQVPASPFYSANGG